MKTKERAEKIKVLVQEYIQKNVGVYCGKHWEGTPDPWTLIKDNVLVELVSDKQIYKGSRGRVYTYQVNRKIPYFSPHIEMDNFSKVFKEMFGMLSEVSASIHFPTSLPGHTPIVPVIYVVIQNNDNIYYHVQLLLQ